MNLKPYLLGLLLAAAAITVRAQQPMEFLPESSPAAPQTEQVKYTLLKPEDKTSENVKDGERNPYGKSETELQAGDQKGTNEENQIRDRLSSLRVVGTSPGPKGLRVMLGDMVLEAGANVPTVLPEQTVMLRVGQITAQSIELIWVEKKPSGLPPRTMTIPVDIRPSVRMKLPGQSNEKNQWDKQKSGAGEVPVSKIFPDVAQSAGASATQMAQNTAAPRAIPVSESSKESDSPLPPKPTEKPDPQWEKAMDLIDSLLPKGNDAP